VIVRVPAVADEPASPEYGEEQAAEVSRAPTRRTTP
jgi:hypothetical protein